MPMATARSTMSTDSPARRREHHGRATFAFSRDMTIEAFLQPFVAVGALTDIRKLARPSSFDFEPVTLRTA